ncbi:hypothetical protein [Microscilla marina]|uniref:Fibronectin type III domain protein n=1 Tax=Microscilla marina ATCC 23134 TaxID=313606 RepID=A1ZTL0_MICM2|nr:hypothetical protein [Microscilla marina]EAY26270.1 fibronectin type III domain protein [Microscilla marina ATCC 23134]
MILHQKYLRLLWLLLVWIGISQFGYAQSTQEDAKPAVGLITRAYPDSIALRWAPNNAVAWKYTTKYGYTLQKFLVWKDGKVLDKAIRLDIPVQTFKPLPLAAWKKLVANPTIEKQAAIAAQALYGKTFSAETQTAKDRFTKIANTVREQNMRFTYALLAADQSFVVAKAMGLAWVDRNIRPNEKYLYKVVPKVPKAKYAIEGGFRYTGASDYQPLPAPVDLKAYFGNQAAVLRWNRSYHEHLFTSYFVERSADGKNFELASPLPVTNPVQNDPQRPNNQMFYNDSLPTNGQVYHYRVYGVTPFGEKSKPSKVVSGKGKSLETLMPVMDQPQVMPGGKVQLRWSFPKNKEMRIKGFWVERARKADGRYQAIHQSILVPNVRAYVDLGNGGASYYRIKVVDKAAKTSQTFPYLAQQPDSIPPVKPTQLMGKIDSNGVVRLSWQAVPDKDVKGYKVFRANFANAEYALVSRRIVSQTSFVDTVSLNTLTPTVHYKVMALDQYLNQSDMSDAYVVLRPDTIPPVQPAFQLVMSTDTAVVIKWIKSSSHDVRKHVLYRAKIGTNEWKQIALFEKNKPQNNEESANVYSDYTDKDIEANKVYQYTLVAVDAAGLESAPAKPVAGKIIDRGLKQPIRKINYEVNTQQQHIRLKWEYPLKNVSKILIYRAKEFEPLQLYSTVGGNTRTFKDTKIHPNVSYRYCLKAEFKGGGQSVFSKEIIVSQ